MAKKKQDEEKQEIKDVVVSRDAAIKKIVLPRDLEIPDAIKWLERKEAEEQEVVAIHEPVHAYPMDGVIAFRKAIEKVYGWSQHRGKKFRTLFGESRNPPQMVSVEVGVNESIEVPWGAFAIPGIMGELVCDTEIKDNQPIFVVTGKVRRKDLGKVKDLMSLTREIAAEESIYKGQAVRIEWEAAGFFGMELRIGTPQFINLAGVEAKELIFSKPLMDQIRVSLFTPIERPEVCRQHGIPTKRGILLEGPFGTGKTMTAHVAAKKCVEQGRTFIYIKDVSRLADALRFAQQYAPAMIFAEDVDRVLKGERNDTVNEILNIIDGIESKNAEVMVVLTTNFVENINEAMYRPGRLDDIISVLPPDADAVKRLMVQYGRGLIAEDADLEPAATILSGEIPAVIREAVERAKLAAISRAETDEEMENLTLNGEDLVIAANSLRAQSDLLKRAQQREDPEDIQRARAFGDALGGAVSRGVAGLLESRSESLSLGDGVQRHLPSTPVPEEASA